MSSRPRAEKLTVTFDDGHAEEFDVFVAVVADGLTQIGKGENGRPYYMGEEGFSVLCMASMAIGTEVVAALVKGLIREVNTIMTSADKPEQRAALIKAMLETDSVEAEGGYEKTEVIELHQNEN